MTKSFGPGEGPRTVNGAIWSMLIIALGFCGLRLYCRAVRSKKLWWDDYILVISAALLIIATSFLTKAMAIGYLDYDPNSVNVVLNWRVAQTHQIVSLALGKTSFGLTLLRFSTKFEKYVIWFVIVTVNLLFAVHAIVLWLGPCGHPLPYHHIPGVCWAPTNAIILNITAAMYSALTDLIFALLPWKVILNLNMKKSEKISIAITMSVGVIAAIAGLMKGVQSIITIDYTKPSFGYDITIFWIFLMAEPNATLIAACIPSLRGLFRDVRNKTSGKYNSPGAAGYLRSTNSKFHVYSNKNGTRHGGASGTGVEQTELGETDANSDKSILGYPKPSQGIERTMEVRVEYDAESRETTDAYEMQPQSSKMRTRDHGADGRI